MFTRQQSRKSSSSCTIDDSLLSTLPYTYHYRTAAVNLANLYVYTNENALNLQIYGVCVYDHLQRDRHAHLMSIHVHLLSKPGVCTRAQCIHLPYNSPPSKITTHSWKTN